MSDTIARLSAAAHQQGLAGVGTPSKLDALTDFGSNPGALRAFVHIPADLSLGVPLVVVLHGCTQSAGGYDRASGWSQLAEKAGFAVLYPEQQRGNNANGCFNWFEPADTRRGSGEAASIRQMIAAMRERHGVDERRIFVVGLSAGGAMAATMLAVYPEVFAGGAIIAGLPHGVAAGVSQALDRMRGHGLPDEDRLGAALRGASAHSGPWPRISIWHGGADATVSVRNADAILAQWRGVHGLAASAARIDQVDNFPRRTWQGPDGVDLIEEYILPGMGHGTPLKTSGADGYGNAAPYMLDVGISSTLRIAEFWEIAASGVPAAADRKPAATELLRQSAQVGERRSRPASEPLDAVGSPSGVGRIIEDALRAAGLMK
ncbi:alpha/beta hydrolase family esterase [Sphingomonas sp. TX0543]|uniref:extracellular catalytic domain type 1 short-chain-length polyhydroxyalkanoate depolymerase n=1 Tax=unclassified Sphingomonas TaxID=196159 RepID=UPI0010F890A1|nr:PHB depolymerase family esterase [Sphingomonas sp. 3P27F8]